MSSVYISLVGLHTEHFQLEITDSSEERQSLMLRISMFAAMTPRSNHTLVISRTGIGRDCCILYKQQQVRSDKICYSKSRTKDQNCNKSPSFRTRLKFCFKDRAKMEQREPTSDPATEGAEGRLRDLTSKWFIDTQVPFIVNNGLFPTWFLGFITRKNAEEILEEKEQGSFLIRLSDKAIGYILSYKGKDRCRHFVISQSETGKFVVCGDTDEHNTIPELIQFYKTRAIEPFGEYLTYSCFEALEDDLYDMIQVSSKDKPVNAPRAAKNVRKQQTNPATEQQPTRPLKNNRTQEEVPPLPRRSRPIDSSTLNDNDNVIYAQLRKQTPRENPRSQNFTQNSLPAANPGKAERLASKDQNNGRHSPPSEPESIYSELNLLESKSRSLPLLDGSSDGEQSYRLSAPPSTPPRLSPRPARQDARRAPESENTDLCKRANNCHSLDSISDTTIYYLAGRPGRPSPALHDNRSPTPEENIDSVYAEVASEALTFTPDSTYEVLPDHMETAKPKPNSSSYEPVEDLKRSANRSSWGLKNDKWKWLHPEAKRKW